MRKLFNASFDVNYGRYVLYVSMIKLVKDTGAYTLIPSSSRFISEITDRGGQKRKEIRHKHSSREELLRWKFQLGI